MQFLDMHMLTNAQHIYFAKENDNILLILHVFFVFFNLKFAWYIKLNFRKSIEICIKHLEYSTWSGAWCSQHKSIELRGQQFNLLEYISGDFVH